jgi:hypothetical protein
MNCPECKTNNEADAAFCGACGKPLARETVPAAARFRKTYQFMLMLLPVLAIVVGIGYYKYFLPEGIAAVVNDEEIKLTDLDAAVRIEGKANIEAASDRVRYQVLNQMIAERIILQEARKAGIVVTKQELGTASEDARIASGLDKAAFEKEIVAQYGSLAAFESSASKRLIINKFFAEKVVPPGADPQTARIAMNQWFNGASGKAAVRIALVEQAGGAGCGGGCKKANGQTPQGTRAGCGNCRNGEGSGKPGCAAMQSPGESTQLSVKAQAVQAEALAYWKEKHGNDAVEARTEDFGCHLDRKSVV